MLHDGTREAQRFSHELAGHLFTIVAHLARLLLDSAGTTERRPVMAMRKIAGRELPVVTSVKDRSVLVDFGATWCGPCRMLHPVLEQLAAEMKDTWDFYEIDVDESASEANTFGVRSVPTLVIFRDGREVDRLVGFRDKAALKAHLTSLAAK
jgi:thioredoxin 1